MPFVYRRYGPVTETTEYEKQPSPPQNRVQAPRPPKTIYGARRPNSVFRTRQVCVRRMLSAIEEFGAPLFFTLTFDGDATDLAYASSSLSRFALRLRAMYTDAEYVFVPELSPNKRLHFHGLVFNVPMSWGDIKVGRRIFSYGLERQYGVFAGAWSRGFVDCLQTDGSGKLAYYISKYITKAGNDLFFAASRILRISYGIPHEIKIIGEYAEFLTKRIRDKKLPTRSYSLDTKFLGKITKEFYIPEDL